MNGYMDKLAMGTMGVHDFQDVWQLKWPPLTHHGTGNLQA